jgi:hypothetical protein
MCFRLQVREEKHTWLGPLETVIEISTDPVSETLCFLVSGIPDDGQSPKTQ